MKYLNEILYHINHTKLIDTQLGISESYGSTVQHAYAVYKYTLRHVHFKF